MTKTIKIAAILALASTSYAADSNPTPKVWISPGFVSYHFDRHANLNEVNPGISVEYSISPSQSFVAGTFKNSESTQSTYIGGTYQPWIYDKFKFGAVAGIINGYSGTNGKFTPMVAPVLTYEQSNIGINVLVIPNMPVNNARIHGAVAVQFKFSFN